MNPLIFEVCDVRDKCYGALMWVPPPDIQERLKKVPQEVQPALKRAVETNLALYALLLSLAYRLGETRFVQALIELADELEKFADKHFSR